MTNKERAFFSSICPSQVCVAFVRSRLFCFFCIIAATCSGGVCNTKLCGLMCGDFLILFSIGRRRHDTFHRDFGVPADALAQAPPARRTTPCRSATDAAPPRAYLPPTLSSLSRFSTRWKWGFCSSGHCSSAVCRTHSSEGMVKSGKGGGGGGEGRSATSKREKTLVATAAGFGGAKGARKTRFQPSNWHRRRAAVFGVKQRAGDTARGGD